MTVDDLGKKSVHRNPNIVNILHRADFIEKLGTGLLRIDEELIAADLPKAEFEISNNWFSIIFKRKAKRVDETYSSFDGEVHISERSMTVLKFCSEKPRSRSEILEHLGLTNDTRNYRNNVLPLIDLGLIRMTLPDTPNNKNQKYVLTTKGKQKISEE